MSEPTESVPYQGKYLSIKKDGRWEYASRTNATGCVGILAITADGKLVLVEQMRLPLKAQTIELTAGLIGDEADYIKETIAQCANRELIEETGYSSTNIIHLLTSPSSAGLTDEMVHLYLATDLTTVGPGGGVANEDIIIHHVPLNELISWADRQSKLGKVIDAKIFSCLYLAQQKGFL